MPFRPCPICRREASRMLEGPTAVALVIYYRCDTCGAVFHFPKHDPHAAPIVVTETSNDDNPKE